MMSSTELERFKKRLRDAQAKVYALTLPLWDAVLVRHLEGEVLDRNGLSIEGLEVLTSLGQRVTTDSEGRFFLKLIGARVSLTLRWRGVELKDWVSIELKVGEPTQIKIKWPHLVRGQVLTEGDQGLVGALVTLNDLYQTQTDMYGAFTFPLLEGEQSELDHFIFEIEGERYAHHFRASVGQPPLRLFYYRDDELYHVKNLPRLSPVHAVISEQHRLLNRASTFVMVALAVITLSVLLPSNPPPTPSLPDQLYLNSALSASPVDVEPTERERGEATGHRELELESDTGIAAPPSCDQIEFTYYQYRVPRGMEGFLLSILFGSWQQWKGDLDLLNKISKDNQLQAGQFIKLKLPLHEWRLFTLYPDEGAHELRGALQCTEADLMSCLKVVQVWNPHLDVRSLRRGDSLLINPRLLKRPHWGEDINRRMELLKRSRGRRHARPRLKVKEGCELYPLRPVVAARVKRAQEERERALQREREAKRLERERRREAKRLERERRREAKRRRSRSERRR